MKLNPNHIFIDTNVLNGVYLNKTADVECLQYLFSLKGKMYEKKIMICCFDLYLLSLQNQYIRLHRD